MHRPGLLAQSDFTHMDDLALTLGGVPFPHLIYHLVLTYANLEAISIGFSESFASLAEGLEAGLWQLGGVPQPHRTDNLSAAVVKLERGVRQYTAPYAALMRHYPMQPATNQPGEAHENGDVAQAHYRFKQAVAQARALRGSRDFHDHATYTRWLHDLVRRRNMTRAVRADEERAQLHSCRISRSPPPKICGWPSVGLPPFASCGTAIQCRPAALGRPCSCGCMPSRWISSL